MAKNILLINNAYPSARVSNSGTYAASIKQALENAGFHVDLTVLRPSGNKLKNKIRDYAIFYYRLLTVPLKRYDVLYINHYSFLLPLFVRIPFLKNKIVYHWHGEELIHDTFPFKLIRSLIRGTLKGNDIHISPSFYYKNIIAVQLHIDPTRILVSPSGGVNTNIFKPAIKKQENHSVHIGFPSALTKHKGVDYFFEFIRSIPDLQQKTGKKYVVHYIDYGDTNGYWVEKFSACPVCTVKHPPYRKEEMVNFYQELDICLMLSERESLGLVVLEAMACNVPVIARNNTSMPEMVKSGISGELIPRYPDINDIQEKVKNMTTNKNQYTPAEFVSQHYSSNSVSAFYKQLLKDS